MLLQGPVRVPRSALVGGVVIDTDLMRRENHSRVQVSLTKVSNHGVNFLETGTEVVAMVEAPTLVFLGHEATNHTNDNYPSVPTQLSCQLSRLDHKLSQLHQNVYSLVVHKVAKQNSEQTLRDLVGKKAVSYQDVVSHVHSVTFHGQPQRKGLSPALCVNKIKVVKGVSCVSQCLSAPSVPNVPHVATEISVGGRFQSS